ncbi:hypothetical protein AB0M32_36065, partial [Streptomyces sp. NPDC051985]
RLAKYGVPLADTAPEGLAAAGIDLPALLPAPAPAVPAVPAPAPAAAVAPAAEQRPELAAGAGRPAVPRQAAAPEPEADVNQWLHARDPQQIQYHGDYNPDFEPPYEPQFTEEQYAAWYEQEQQRYQQEQQQPHPTPPPPEPTAGPHNTQPAPDHKQHGTRNDTAIGETPRPPHETTRTEGLTLVDHYYRAWTDYQTRHGREPAPSELSTLLADQGMTGRDNKPINPSTLRRYLLAFRLYTVWAEHRAHTATPSPDNVARDCTHRGITAQYNKPITPTHITTHTNDFQRRWHTLAAHGMTT